MRKASLKKATLFSVLSSCCVAGGVRAAEYQWKPSVLSGYWHEATSWSADQCPADGDLAKFGSNLTGGSEYVVKIADGQADGAAVQVNALPKGMKITFDATGAVWRKVRTSNQWADGNKILRFDNADHIFNIENISSSVASDQYGFTLENGKISYIDTDGGDRLTFESGVFNNWSFDDVESAHRTILLYSVHRQNSRVVFEAGSECHLGTTEIRGQSVGGEVVVNGGDVHFYNGLNIKTYGNASDGVLRVSSGTATVETRALWLGKNAAGAGRLIVDGTGLFEHKGNAVYMPDVVNAVGQLDVLGSGVYRSTTSGISAGHKADSQAFITVSEQGRLEMTGANLNLAEGEDRSYASLTVKGNGYAGIGSLSGANGGTGRRADVVLEENGQLELFGNGSTLSSGTGATANFTMKDDARLMLDSGWLQFGNNSAATVSVRLLGGTIDGDNRPKADGSVDGGGINFRGGPGSEVVFDGVDATMRNLSIEGQLNLSDENPDAAYTNTVVLKSGSLKLRRNGVGEGLDIRGNGRNAMFLQEGGELLVGATGFGMVRIGHGGANNGYHAIFRQTGGVADLGAVVNVCDAAGSDGEVELLGGTTRLWSLRGWNGCETRGGTGKATLHGDGGTVEPCQDGLDFIYTLSGATVGAKGLTVDSKDFGNVKMHVKLDNAAGVDGLFVKKGTGTLKVGLKETDANAKGEFAGRSLNGAQTFTRIDEGTLLLEDQAEAEFGKNIIVKGGATLSLAGTVATLTLDTLTLGDGRGGFAMLALDEGDTVVINGENGLVASCGAIDVPWAATNGTYPVFICNASATVDADQLDKITVYSASAEKDYLWTSAKDEETGVTTWSMVVSDRGTGSSGVTYENGVTSTAGEGLVSVITATGDSTEAGALDLSRTAEVAVEADSSPTLSGAISGTGTDLMKTGSGKLTLAGDNSGFYGSFVSQGGLLEVLTRAALGADPLFFPLVLGNGTFRYDGEPVTYEAPLKLAGDTVGVSVILENNGDMTFQGVAHASGTFVKKGTGALTLALGEGTYLLGHSDIDGNYGENDGVPVFPSSGDAPTEKRGLYGVTIAEGALRVTGVGADKSILSTDNTALLGSGYAAKAAPVLEVVDARVNFGKGGCHGTFVQSYPTTSPVPEIRLTNAWLQVNSPTLGKSTSPTGGTGPIVSMKDSTFFGEYSCVLGNAGHANPQIDADNSALTSDAMFGWMIAATAIRADFHGTNAVFGSVNARDVSTDRAGRIECQDHPTGTVRIRDGARMQTTRGIKFAGGKVELVFDGGVFEILPHTVEEHKRSESTWTNKDRAITTTGDGMEVAICEGSTHTFKVPIAGDGKVVKTGLGTLSFAARAEGEKLLQNTGVTEVAEGTLEIDGALVVETASFKVDAGATLALGGTAMSVASFEAEEGAIVTGASVTTASLKLTAGVVPTFTDSTIAFTSRQGVEIDFGEAGPDLTKEPFPVAKFVDGEGNPLASLDVSAWRGMAKGYTRLTLGKNGGDYRFSYDPATGFVSATYQPRGGLAMVVR